MRRAAAIAAVALLGATASAAHGATVGGLHDARYCEVFEVRGAVPDAEAIVWNTIGRGDCPQEAWSAIDPAAIAAERGATLVVLNGPRHFLMDRATATTGEEATIGGLPMTAVATLPLRTQADLVSTPYADRVVERENTWRWRAGRTVFELVAPGGDVYVMQSYAQIVDPALTLDALPSLGRRLDLPDGWRYRARTLKRPLTLAARGSATILQDELRNTYQLATPREHGRRERHAVDMSGETKTVLPPPIPGRITDRGTVTGTPFGDGTIVLVGDLKPGRLEATIRMRFADGEIRVETTLPATVEGNQIEFRGVARVTGGTGAYRGIAGTLRVHDTNTLDGQNGRLTFDGTVRY